MQGHPDVEIKIGDKTYTARFSVKAWAALHDYYNISSLSELTKRITDPNTAGVKDIIAGIWGALQTHHKGISMDEVADILDELGLQAAQKKLYECFDKSIYHENGDNPASKKEVVESRP